MGIKRLEVQRDHLERLIKTPATGVEELIWNAIDADASAIHCNVYRSAAGGITSFTVQDNGDGFNEERAELSFGRLGGSWKRATVKTDGGRGLHGKAGQGRLSAFGIGDRVSWTTTSDAVADSGPRRTVRISGVRTNIEQMTLESLEVQETEGTIVEVTYLNDAALRWLESDKPRQRLAATFALTLEQYGVRLYWNKQLIDPVLLQDNRWSTQLTVEDVDTTNSPIILEIIEWSIPADRKLLVCDENGTPLLETKAGIHAPGYNFTAYVRWAGFKEHATELILADFLDSDIDAVLTAARKSMKEYFATRIRTRGTELVERWKTDEIYPYKQEARSDIEKAERELFEIVAVTAADAFKDTDSKSQRLSLHLIKEALENNPAGLHDVLSEVIGLHEQDLEDLARLLRETTLSNMIRATRDIGDRLKFIAGLEETIYGDDLRKTLLERTQLHRILAQETWIFRDEYQLTADDDTLTKALTKYGHYFKADDASNEPEREAAVLDHLNGEFVVDLMLSRVIEQRENRRHHIVVEIKRPTVHIGLDQISQIERYASAVVSEPRFDLATTSWEFWIVGDKIATNARMKTAQQGLIQAPSSEFPVTIRAVSWSQIIADARHRLKFVQSALAISPTTADAMTHLRTRHGEFLPDLAPDETRAEEEDELELPEVASTPIKDVLLNDSSTHS